MEWAFDHLRLIVIVGGAIAYWLNQRRKAKEEQVLREMTQVRPQTTQQSDDAERTRRIQEEIRRKILERTGGGPKQQTPPVKVEIAEAPPLVPSAQPVMDSYSQPTEEQSAAADQAVLEGQQRLAAKLVELETTRRENLGKAEAFAEKTAVAMAASNTAQRGSLLADLRNPTSVRRAVIMREVLGPPVGLR